MNKEEKIFSAEWLGRTLSFRTGLLAQQADAAVTAQYGDTVVLATVVESQEERDVDFFPLMVDFEEKLYAAGIIKGSRWIKREGRPSDNAVLSGRMIDRSIRPLFSGDSRREVQVILTILSVDHENDHEIVSLVAASAALAISGVNWAGPISGIRVGRVDNRLVYNPTVEQMEKSDLNLVVASTRDKIIQIEAGANEIDEDTMYEALITGKKQAAPAIDLIEKMKKELGVKPKVHEKKNISEEELADEKEKQALIQKAEEWLAQNVNKILFDKAYYKKAERKAAVAAIKDGLDNHLFEAGVDRASRAWVKGKTVDKAVDAEVTKELIENKKRVDGRGLKEIRDLTANVELLPRNHGAGLFSRGETQIMSIVTLAGPGLAQNLEGLEGTGEKRFMHHYNFAPFSVGEARFMRGPGRREIGHGALAEKALLPVIPDKEEFPYTIRVVSETMGSNGSSSMGSTCGSSLALMDAGVPIKKAVAGVAIGLASYDDMSDWVVITDIQDLEDGKGGMDFKVTGTRDGITAIQLDTKTLGLTDEIVKEALVQAKEGRINILDVMDKAIDKPRPELSPYAPRITSFHIDPEKIREVIGPGGKIINEIVAEFDVTIDIEDDGLVMVCGVDAAKCEQAVKRINNIVRDPEVGEIFTGKVVRLMDFGAFVELLPGKDGMVHVSKMAPYRVGKPGDMLNIGDKVQVKVEEIDDMDRVNLTMLGLPENESYWKEEKGKQQGFGGGFNRGGGNFRNDRNNDRRPPRRDNRGPRNRR